MDRVIVVVLPSGAVLITGVRAAQAVLDILRNPEQLLRADVTNAVPQNVIHDEILVEKQLIHDFLKADYAKMEASLLLPPTPKVSAKWKPRPDWPGQKKRKKR